MPPFRLLGYDNNRSGVSEGIPEAIAVVLLLPIAAFVVYFVSMKFAGKGTRAKLQAASTAIAGALGVQQVQAGAANDGDPSGEPPLDQAASFSNTDGPSPLPMSAVAGVSTVHVASVSAPSG
jgi:hypothetical protein